MRLSRLFAVPAIAGAIWPAAGPGGLGAELTATLYTGNLDEDIGEDQIYAVVAYYDSNRHENVSHPTGTVHGGFAAVSDTGGGGGCLIVCQ